MYQRLQQAQQDNTEKFQQEQQKKMQPIMQKVMNAVNTVAQEGGYVYIIDKKRLAAGWHRNQRDT